MKGRTLTAALLALCLLSGCGALPGGNAPEEAPPEEAALSGELTASRIDREARPPTDDEIMAAYQRAEGACGWFGLAPLPVGEESREVDGRTYYRVREPGMENLADLRAYLRGLFSEEMVESLLSIGGDAPLYRDVEGALYALPFSRERDSARGTPVIQIVPLGETAYAVDVTVDIVDETGTVTGAESYTFPYELVDGQWVFTAFRLTG